MVVYIFLYSWSCWPLNLHLKEKRLLRFKYSLVTYFKEQSPSWKTNRFSASQEIPSTLWDPKVHYRIYKCPPTVYFLMFRNLICFYGKELFAPRLTSKLEDHSLSAVPLLLIQYIHSYSPYCRPFLDAQPEEAPCRGDRDPLITEYSLVSSHEIQVYITT